MANLGRIVAQAQSIELRGTAKPSDVMEIGAITKPSEVFFQFRIPIGVWRAEGAIPVAEAYAEQIEIIMGSPLVFGMSYVQDVNLAGNLVDYMDIVVGIAEGDATTIVSEKLTQLDWGIVGPKIFEAETI